MIKTKTTKVCSTFNIRFRRPKLNLWSAFITFMAQANHTSFEV